MYSRRDTFRLLVGAAAIIAVPTSAGIAATSTVVGSPAGDLLPADGGWFKASEFPELATHMREEYDWKVKHARVILDRPDANPHHAIFTSERYGRERTHYTAVANPPPIERDGMIRLPKYDAYTKYEGLLPDGTPYWSRYRHYVKAIPTPTDQDDYRAGNGVGRTVEVVDYTLEPIPEFNPPA